MISYKQKCARCKNMVLITSRNQFPLCYECQKGELSKVIKDKKMKAFFNLPEDCYRESPFLRSVKSYYLKFDKISDKQRDAFKKVVDDIKARKEGTNAHSKEVRSE